MPFFATFFSGIVPLEELVFLKVYESKRGESTLISLTPTPVHYRDGRDLHHTSPFSTPGGNPERKFIMQATIVTKPGNQSPTTQGN